MITSNFNYREPCVDTDDALISNKNNQLVIMQHIVEKPCSRTVANGYPAIGWNISHEEDAIEFSDLTKGHRRE